jgi:AICAR transformylase/IMP cyclohydrolase PurH
MAEDAEDLLRRNREIEKIKELEEVTQLLDDKVSGVQRALVELKATITAMDIHVNLAVNALSYAVGGKTTWRSMAKKHDDVMSELRVALASLRGKLAAGEVIGCDCNGNLVMWSRMRN